MDDPSINENQPCAMTVTPPAFVCKRCGATRRDYCKDIMAQLEPENVPVAEPKQRHELNIYAEDDSLIVSVEISSAQADVILKSLGHTEEIDGEIEIKSVHYSVVVEL